jgi:hypothetical protein
VLSGRKIDAEKGCVIKAEMAKKNLHTKRGLSSAQDIHKLPYPNSIASFRRRSVPEGFDQQYYKGQNDYGQQYDSMYNDYQSNYQGHYLDITGNDVFDPFSPADPILDMDHDRMDQYYSNECLSPTEPEFDSKLPPLFGSSQPSRGFSSVLYNSDALLSKSLGTMSMGDFPGAESFGRSGSFSYSNATHPGADQNPPCNTLYVGNLPNDNCEEELRHLFQCCPGYKRLCFKTRVNGPMCFVEVILY